MVRVPTPGAPLKACFFKNLAVALHLFVAMASPPHGKKALAGAGSSSLSSLSSQLAESALRVVLQEMISRHRLSYTFLARIMTLSSGCRLLAKQAMPELAKCVYRGGRTALYLAAAKGRTAWVRQLLEAGAEVDAITYDEYEDTPAHQAARNGHTEVLRLLIQAGANVDYQQGNGWSTVHRSCWRGHVECLRLILDAGPDLDLVDNAGGTAAHDAACYGHTECLRLLIDAGIDTAQADDDGDLPLHLAAREGQYECVRLLVEKSETSEVLETRNEDNWTALHFAVDGKYLDILKFLLGSGADVTAMDGDGNTALHIAAIRGHTECARALVDSGADVEQANNDGETPAQIAANHGHDDCAKALVDTGAK